MVLGLGIDTVEINRIEKAIRNEHFRKRCFTERELNVLCTKKAHSYAGYFCAKEAAAKALGTGFRGFSLQDIEIQNDEYGKPMIFFYHHALALAQKLSVTETHVSISHSLCCATAVVLLCSDVYKNNSLQTLTAAKASLQ